MGQNLACTLVPYRQIFFYTQRTPMLINLIIFKHFLGVIKVQNIIYTGMCQNRTGPDPMLWTGGTVPYKNRIRLRIGTGNRIQSRTVGPDRIGNRQVQDSNILVDREPVTNWNWLRGGERQRDRETETQMDKERRKDRETETQRYRETEKQSERSSERASDRASERASERATERSIERASEQAVERSSQRASERASERAVERSSERASDRSSDRASERAIIERSSER